MRASACLLVLAFGCDVEVPHAPDCVEDPFAPVECADRPDLCDLPVDSTINQPDLADAIDIVYVSDGFPADALDEFRFLVDAHVVAMARDPTTIVGRAPGRFNHHVIALSAPATATRFASRFGTCRDGRGFESNEAAARLVARNAPDADAIVHVIRAEGGASAGTPSGRTPVVRLGVGQHWRVLDHELGHALVHLGDEYGAEGESGCLQSDPVVATTAPFAEPVRIANSPNLSVRAGGARWPEVDGSVPGGDDFACGIHHPTDTCRMNDASAPRFCPVCAAAIDRFLDPPDAPLPCHLTASRVDGALEVRAHADGWPRGFDPTLAGHRTVDDTPARHRYLLHCRDHAGREALRSVMLVVDGDRTRFEPADPDLPWAAPELVTTRGDRWVAEAPVVPGTDLPGCGAVVGQAILRFTAPATAEWRFDLEIEEAAGRVGLDLFRVRVPRDLPAAEPACTRSWVNGRPPPQVAQLSAGEVVHLAVNLEEAPLPATPVRVIATRVTP